MSEESGKYKELYMRMKLIRFVEESIAEKYPEGKMRCPTHLCTGQEAISAGVGLALEIHDYAVSTHRSHGHYLGKGGSLPKMIAEIYGKATGCSKGKGGSMHLVDKSVGFMGSTAIVGNSIPIGAGLALAAKLDKRNQVSCIFLGDAAIEEGVFAETVNFCAQRQLPVLFVCENNFYSVYSPLAVRQPQNRSISKMVEAMGIRSNQGNGNDGIEVYEKTKKVISEIKSNSSPRFLEFETYRWREHCGPNYDNDIGYRSEKEFLKWKDRDPIKIIEEKLIEKGHLLSSEIIDIDSSLNAEVEKAFTYAENSPFPDPDDAYNDIYSEA